jgi:hypothetical protein
MTPPRNMLQMSVKNCTAVTTASMHLTFHLSLLIMFKTSRQAVRSQHMCAHHTSVRLSCYIAVVAFKLDLVSPIAYDAVDEPVALEYSVTACTVHYVQSIHKDS